jgi:hypothetical protein
MATFSAFPCFQLRDATARLIADPEITCWSDDHWQLVGISVLAIVFYV